MTSTSRIENPFIAIANEREGIDASRIPCVLRESYAQYGEDTIVEALLRARLFKQGRAPSSLTYVEIGANHPVATSNTYLLYRKYGAAGTLVEADPGLIDRLKKVRPRDTVLNVAISACAEPKLTLHVASLTELSSLRAGHTKHFRDIRGNDGVTATVDVPNLHINDFLRRYAPANLDFLSIDCEGVDLEIIAALAFETYKPYIVQCEPSEHILRGARRKIVAIMERNGYRVIAVTDVNLIFVLDQNPSARELPLTDRLRNRLHGFALRVRGRLARMMRRR